MKGEQGFREELKPPPKTLVVNLVEEEIDASFNDQIERFCVESIEELKAKCATKFQCEIAGFSSDPPSPDTDHAPMMLLTLPKLDNQKEIPLVFVIEDRADKRKPFNGTSKTKDPKFIFRVEGSPEPDLIGIGTNNHKDGDARERKREQKRRKARKMDDEENWHGKYEGARHRHANQEDFIHVKHVKKYEKRRSESSENTDENDDDNHKRSEDEYESQSEEYNEEAEKLWKKVMFLHDNGEFDVHKAVARVGFEKVKAYLEGRGLRDVVSDSGLEVLLHILTCVNGSHVDRKALPADEMIDFLKSYGKKTLRSMCYDLEEVVSKQSPRSEQAEKLEEDVAKSIKMEIRMFEKRVLSVTEVDGELKVNVDLKRAKDLDMVSEIWDYLETRNLSAELLKNILPAELLKDEDGTSKLIEEFARDVQIREPTGKRGRSRDVKFLDFFGNIPVGQVARAVGEATHPVLKKIEMFVRLANYMRSLRAGSSKQLEERNIEFRNDILPDLLMIALNNEGKGNATVFMELHEHESSKDLSNKVLHKVSEALTVITGVFGLVGVCNNDEMEEELEEGFTRLKWNLSQASASSQKNAKLMKELVEGTQTRMTLNRLQLVVSDVEQVIKESKSTAFSDFLANELTTKMNDLVRNHEATEAVFRMINQMREKAKRNDMKIKVSSAAYFMAYVFESNQQLYDRGEFFRLGTVEEKWVAFRQKVFFDMIKVFYEVLAKPFSPSNPLLVTEVRKRIENPLRLFPSQRNWISVVKIMCAFLGNSWYEQPSLCSLIKILKIDVENARKLLPKLTGKYKLLLKRSLLQKQIDWEEVQPEGSFFPFFLTSHFFVLVQHCGIGIPPGSSKNDFRTLRRLFVQIPCFLRKCFDLLMYSVLSFSDICIWKEQLRFASRQAARTILNKNSKCSKFVSRVFPEDGWDEIAEVILDPDRFNTKILCYLEHKHLANKTKFSSSVADVRAFLDEFATRFPDFDLAPIRKCVSDMSAYIPENPPEPMAIPFAAGAAFIFLIKCCNNCIQHMINPSPRTLSNMIVFPSHPFKELFAILSVLTHLCMATRTCTNETAILKELEVRDFAIIQKYRIFKTNGARDGYKIVLSVRMNDLTYPSLDTFLQFYKILLPKHLRSPLDPINPMASSSKILYHKKRVKLRTPYRTAYRKICVEIFRDQNIDITGKKIGYYSSRHALFGLIKNAISGHDEILKMIAGHKTTETFSIYYKRTDISDKCAPALKRYFRKNSVRIPSHWPESLAKIAQDAVFEF